MASYTQMLDVPLCAEQDTTSNVHAAFHAGIPLIIFHPGKMQIQSKTNAKSIKSFIKHLSSGKTSVLAGHQYSGLFSLDVTLNHAS